MPAYSRREAFLLNSEEFAGPRWHFAAACKASRDWSAQLSDALAAFGDHGPNISGCGRDHFPADVKDRLRALARSVTTHCDEAHAARPRNVHFSTMRTLGQLVAMRDGTGFYGPQPLRPA